MKRSTIFCAALLVLSGGCAQAPPDVQLASAILQDDPAAVAQAVKTGAPVESAFRYQEEHKKHYVAEFDIDHIWSKLPLKVAAEQGKAQAVQALLTAGANPNRCDFGSGAAPLHGLASVAVGEKLIAGGADVNLPVSGYYPGASAYKPTPLMIALRQGHRDLAELLLKHGAKVQARDGEGSTAWRYVDPLRPDLRRLLLSYGAKPNDSGLSATQLQALRQRREKEGNRLEAQRDRRDSRQIQKEEATIDAIMRQPKP